MMSNETRTDPIVRARRPNFARFRLPHAHLASASQQNTALTESSREMAGRIETLTVALHKPIMDSEKD